MNNSITAPAPLPAGRRILGRGHHSSLYTVRLARTREEIRAAQTLRFLVFNVELGEGLESSFATLRDEDPFDAVCDHLIVVDQRGGEIVGTYRLQTGATAAAKLGYYSAGEFDFAPFERIRYGLVELGRACVHQQHRNLTVLSLLWNGIRQYAEERCQRWFIGCTSLPSTDPVMAATAHEQLARRHLAPAAFRTHPLPAYACPPAEPSADPVPLPRLLLAYLSLGARICGAPALDREFKTVDFLTLMDLQGINAAR